MQRVIRRRVLSSLSLLSLGALGACSDIASKTGTEQESVGASAQALTTVTFRHNVSGYTGTEDLYISTQNVAQNGPNGTTVRDDVTLPVFVKTGTGGYEAETLIRFKSLTLPAGARVTAAQLTLTFDNWWTDFTLRGYFVKNTWNGASTALGWVNRDTGLTWNTPGAKGLGTDVHTTLAFSNSTWVGNGDETKTFNLDPAMIQSWVNTPATNQGIILVNNQASDRLLKLYASEDGTATRRPLLSITYDTADTTAPTVAMTAPTNGSTVSSPVTLTANASDSGSDVAGVQFLADGSPIGAEDTAAPYSISTSSLTPGSHTLAARARDAAGNLATSTTVTVTVSAGGARSPRIFLDATTLQALRTRAQASDPQWTALRTVCNSYNGGTVQAASTADATCSAPNICPGYQGEDYVDPALSLGLCYQIGLGIGDANTTTWGNKGVEILTRLAEVTETSATTARFARDSGYGIRNYAVAMAIGYDWFHPALSSALKTTLYTRLNQWIAWYEASGFVRHDPHANYFAGYYAAKAYAGLATEGDNPSGATMWSDFLNRVHKGGANSLGTHAGVARYYTSYLNGGGWTEGWGYGAQGVRNMSLPTLAARTAKNIDLINDATAPYRYPLANGMYLMQFSWPSRTNMDDGDIINRLNSFPEMCPSVARQNPYTFTVIAAMLSKWNDPLAPRFHSFARAVRTTYGNPRPWVDFLFWDNSATEADFKTLPTSYQAWNDVAMRNDWETTSTWASLRAMGYVDAPDSGEQYGDAGALVITRGSTPLLANVGFLHSCYGPTAPVNYATPIRAEIFEGTKPTRIFNTFYNGNTGQAYGAAISVDKASGAPATRVSRFEDRNGYVLTSARDLEDVYWPGAGIASWSRDVVYFRPSAFVVYDRTAVNDLTGNQHMNWHFPPLPTSVTPPSTGARRYDVSDSIGGFKGAMTTLLPANATVSTVNVFNSNRLYRLEVSSPAPALDSRWLTVFDTATSATGVALSSVITSSTNVKGALLKATGGNMVALFGAGAAGVDVTGAVTFTQPATATKVVIADLAPNTSYSVSAVVSGTNLNVTVQPGAGFTTSAAGTLYVNIAANGGVTAGT